MRETSLWQEVTSIPLQAYFLTIGALLTALWLLVNFVLDPSKPESPQPAMTDLSKSWGTARTTTGSVPAARSIAPVALAARAPSELPTTPTLAESGRRAASGRRRGGSEPVDSGKAEEEHGAKVDAGQRPCPCGILQLCPAKPVANLARRRHVRSALSATPGC